MADFSELLKLRRSVRDYQDRPVSMEVLHEIIGESWLAPSSGNGQPWRVAIITDSELMRRLSTESKKNLLDRIDRDPAVYFKKYESVLRDPEFNVFYNAPALVIIGGEKTVPNLEVDCALFAGYFMFSAADKNLGTCWVNLGRDIRDPELLDTIGMTGDLRIVAPLIVGYPKQIWEPPDRNEPCILRQV